MTFVPTFWREFRRNPPPTIFGHGMAQAFELPVGEKVIARDGVGDKRAVDMESGILNIRI